MSGFSCVLAWIKEIELNLRTIGYCFTMVTNLAIFYFIPLYSFDYFVAPIADNTATTIIIINKFAINRLVFFISSFKYSESYFVDVLVIISTIVKASIITVRLAFIIVNFFTLGNLELFQIYLFSLDI